MDDPIGEFLAHEFGYGFQFCLRTGHDDTPWKAMERKIENAVSLSISVGRNFQVICQLLKGVARQVSPSYVILLGCEFENRLNAQTVADISCPKTFQTDNILLITFALSRLDHLSLWMLWSRTCHQQRSFNLRTSWGS